MIFRSNEASSPYIFGKFVKNCHPKVHNLNLDVKNQAITFVLKADRDVLVPHTIEYSFEKNSQHASTVTVKPIVNPIELKSKSLRDKLEYLKSELNIELYHENRDHTEQFANLLIEHQDVFGDGTLGLFKKEVEIHVTGEPVSIRQHALNKDFENSANDQIQEMLRLRVIEPCPDPKGWNSPIVCVRKKDNSCRVCINLKSTVNKRLSKWLSIL